MLFFRPDGLWGKRRWITLTLDHGSFKPHVYHCSKEAGVALVEQGSLVEEAWYTVLYVRVSYRKRPGNPLPIQHKDNVGTIHRNGQGYNYYLAG